MPRRGTGAQATIRSWLRTAITRNQLGGQLPTVRDLARQFECSITPVHRALQQLQKEGWISMHHGSGSVIKQIHRPAITVLLERGRADMQEPTLRGSNWAAHEWLFYHLMESGDVQVRLQSCGVTAVSFCDAMERSIGEAPAVIVFAWWQHFTPAMRAIIARARERDIAIMHWASVDELEQVDCIEHDFQAGMYLLTAAMLGRGAQRPLRIVSPGNPLFERQKQAGFVALMGEMAPALTLVIPDHIRRHDDEVAWLHTEIPQAISTTGADAILAVNDAQVAALYSVLTENGLVLPVAGYDRNWNEMLVNEPGRAALGPEPISIDRNMPELGRKLSELAIARACGDLPPEPQRIRIPPQLFVPQP